MLPMQRKKVDMSLMTEEEKKMFRLYGKLPTNKPVMKTMAKKSDRQYFDSGDYAMSKAGVAPQSALGTAIPSPENIPHSSPNPAKAPSTDPLSISPPGTSIVIPAPKHSPPAQPSPIKDNVIVADDLEGASEELPKASDAMDITKPASPNRLSKLSPFSSVPLVSPPMDTTPAHASHMREGFSADPDSEESTSMAPEV